MRLPVRSIFVSAIAIFLISLVLTTTGAIAAPGIVSDFLSEITGIKESAIKAILDPTTGKIPLKVLPTGHNGGFDADLLDGQHGSYYASSDELKALSISVATLSEKLNAPSGELILVSKLNGLTGEISLVAGVESLSPKLAKTSFSLLPE